MRARLFAGLIAVLMVGFAAAADDPLVSQLEASAATPASLETCAAMMDEATDQERLALAALKFDLMAKVNDHSTRSTSLMQSAFECTKAAEFTATGDARFRKAMAEWKSQHDVLAVAMAAKLKAATP